MNYSLFAFEEYLEGDYYDKDMVEIELPGFNRPLFSR
ncbi:hypothetical protein GGR27_001120 [Lewinella antarctica]|uniref:Maturase K n=1 Tax=Neolewinella antarctica TaxID=442734 RepID=A0ABX0X8N6_9BACT|nr:hypothetical protein [Neolewinella antarctica]